jgi:hypothetical protein
MAVYDMWVPYIVVGMEYEVQGRTVGEELMLSCKFWKAMNRNQCTLGDRGKVKNQ